jgi:hypothetical protein
VFFAVCPIVIGTIKNNRGYLFGFKENAFIFATPFEKGTLNTSGQNAIGVYFRSLISTF